jgi:hypothetical protein
LIFILISINGVDQANAKIVKVSHAFG